MTASDGKQYNTDCLCQDGINLLLLMLPAKEKGAFTDWFQGRNDPVDEQSKKKAYELYSNSILKDSEVGTIKGLQQIHGYLFEGLYDFAGKIRNKNISKGGFAFANCQFFNEIFEQIESMPENNINQIIDKYIEANIAHPVIEGAVKASLYSKIRQIFETRGLSILELNGEPDHVHILFEADPATAPGELIAVVKTQSSRWIRKHYGETALKKWYWKPYFWSDSYFVTTVGTNSLAAVQEYIKNQKSE